MKFIVSGIEISNACSKVSKALSTKTTNPILEGIKLSCKGDDLTLIATDAEITIEKTIAVQTLLEGEVLVPGKIFTDFVKKLENEDEVCFEGIDGKIKINYGVSEFSIQTLDVTEFPIINKDIKEKFLTLKQGEFKDLILNTIFACSQNPHNTSRVDACFIKVQDNEISAVATDTGRIAINRKVIEQSSGNFSILVTPRTLNEIVRILDKDDNLFTIIVQKNIIMCESEGTILISTLIDGNFVNYENLLNLSCKTEIKVNRICLLSSLERASIIATEYNKAVKFDISEKCLNIFAKSEVGKVSENLPIDLVGSDVEIVFYLKYLVDALKAIKDEYIKISFNLNINPCIITPISGNDYIHIILPVRKFV